MSKADSTARFVIEQERGPLDGEIIDLSGKSFDAFRECPVCGTGCRIIGVDVAWGPSTFNDAGPPVLAIFRDEVKMQVDAKAGDHERGVIIGMRCCNGDEWLVHIEENDRGSNSEPDIDCCFKVTRVRKRDCDASVKGNTIAFSSPLQNTR